MVKVTTINKGTRSRNQRRTMVPMNEINVTPFVDVALVLLIIFMVTAPLLTVGVPLNLPQTSAKALASKQEPLIISLDEKGRVYLQDSEVKHQELIPRLQAMTQLNHEMKIFVRGDKNIPYGHVVALMGDIQRAGFTQVALVTQSPPTTKKQ